jgi:hypothetical protein
LEEIPAAPPSEFSSEFFFMHAPRKTVGACDIDLVQPGTYPEETPIGRCSSLMRINQSQSA